MKKIQNSLSRATVAESCTLALNIAMAILKFNLSNSYLSALAEKLSLKGKEMQKSIASDKSKDLTEALLAADNLRDNLFNALKLFLRAHIKWLRETISDNAAKIYAIVKTHGIALDRKNYEEQSSLLDSLLADFSKPENIEKIKSTDLSELIMELNEAQSDFKNLYRESVSIEAGKEPVVAAIVLKREIRKIQQEIIDYLNVMSKSNEETYGAVTAEVAELVAQQNQKIRNRK